MPFVDPEKRKISLRGTQKINMQNKKNRMKCSCFWYLKSFPPISKTISTVFILNGLINNGKYTGASK